MSQENKEWKWIIAWKGKAQKCPHNLPLKVEKLILIWLQLMISFLECNLICFATDDLVASIHYLMP